MSGPGFTLDCQGDCIDVKPRTVPGVIFMGGGTDVRVFRFVFCCLKKEARLMLLLFGLFNVLEEGILLFFARGHLETLRTIPTFTTCNTLFASFEILMFVGLLVKA
jgi:hypothetical protein